MKSRFKNFNLIVGLGNNGSEHKNTYHNVGFLVIDYIKENFPEIKNVFKIPGYMNEAGKEVWKLVKKQGASPEKMLIIHDDSDIKIGSYKISFNRSSGGHKGAKSIIKSLKTQKFWRLRIGIRPEKEINRKKAGDFVLKKIKKEDINILQNVFEKSSKELFR